MGATNLQSSFTDDLLEWPRIHSQSTAYLRSLGISLCFMLWLVHLCRSLLRILEAEQLLNWYYIFPISSKNWLCDVFKWLCSSSPSLVTFQSLRNIPLFTQQLHYWKDVYMGRFKPMDTSHWFNGKWKAFEMVWSMHSINKHRADLWSYWLGRWTFFSG